MRRIAQTLLIVFVVLKLASLIAWSWWWVLSPLWVAVLIGLGVGIAVALSSRNNPVIDLEQAPEEEVVT